MGHDSYPLHTSFGGTNIEFINDTVVAHKVIRSMNFGKGTCAAISNSAGSLLYYTNGCYIANNYNEVVENGDNLNEGDVFNIQCDTNLYGYTSGTQSAISMQLPGSDSLYYIFHKRIYYFFNPFDVKSLDLLYTVIDMSANGGKGKVIAKNQIAYQDTFSFGEMTAVRHANGTDWWLVSPGDRNNKYFVFRFDASGIELEHTFALGDSTPPAGEGGGMAVFSYDGTKYIRFNPKNKIRMFDFDRATGVLSNYRHIDVDFGTYDPFAGGCGLSPNGRYLYLAVLRYVYQVDLEAPDIAASMQLIAEWDGYGDPLATNYYQPILGPDCKLYVVPGNDTRAIHVIHNPDEAGAACNFEQRGLETPTYHGATVPNFPNFRLGALGEPVSPCAGYVVSSGEAPAYNGALPLLSVFPNPAAQYLRLLPNRPEAAGGHWALYDALGRRVRTAQCGEVSTAAEVPVYDLPAGVYFWELRAADGRRLGSGKVAVGR
jgi:hypothetical protein